MASIGTARRTAAARLSGRAPRAQVGERRLPAVVREASSEDCDESGKSAELSTAGAAGSSAPVRSPAPKRGSLPDPPKQRGSLPKRGSVRPSVRSSLQVGGSDRNRATDRGDRGTDRGTEEERPRLAARGKTADRLQEDEARGGGLVADRI